MKGYTGEQDAWLKGNVEGKDWQTITNKFNQEFGTNKSLRALKSHCNKRLRVCCNRDTTFKKGHVPWNQNITKEEWLSHFSKESIENMAKTQLKKGHTRTKECEIGTIMQVSSGKFCIKTGKGQYGSKKGWQNLSHYAYEKQTGIKPPKGAVIAHLDGDQLNCDIGNLFLTDRRVFSAVLNGYLNARKDVETYKTALMCEQLACISEGKGGAK